MLIISVIYWVPSCWHCVWSLATKPWSHRSAHIWSPWCRFRSQVLPDMPLQVQKALRALFITFFSCAFRVNHSSRISRWYFTSVVTRSLCSEGVGSFRASKSLFLVYGAVPIFCGLIDSWVLSHYCSTILKAFCRSSDMRLRNFPRLWISAIRKFNPLKTNRICVM